MRKGEQNGSAKRNSAKFPKQKKVESVTLNFFYTYILKFILKEQVLGVPKSEKPECTKRTRGFRRQGQRENCPLK